MDEGDETKATDASIATQLQIREKDWQLRAAIQFKNTLLAQSLRRTGI
jgi:hypothetical protein